MGIREQLRNYDNLPPSLIESLPNRAHVIERQSPHGAVLVAIGVPHSNNPRDSQFSVIQDKFFTFAQRTEGTIRVILNEGGLRTPFNEGETSIKQDGEPSLLAYWAKGNNIPIESPEPAIQDEAAELTKRGFSKDHIMYYYFMREIPQWERLPEEVKKKHDVIAYMQKTLAKFKERFKDVRVWDDFEFTVDHMASVHTQLYPGLGISTSHILDQTMNCQKTTTPIQKIARASIEIRDEYIIQQVLKHWNAGTNIFMVYGASHTWAMEDILSSLPDQTDA